MDEKETRRAKLAKIAAKRHVVRRSQRMYAFLERWARRHWVQVKQVSR